MKGTHAKAVRLDVIKGAFINLDPHDIYVIWRGVEYTTSHKISSQSTS